MNSIYYAASKKGYVQKPISGGLNIDSSKRIPVYKVVSEFMNYSPRQIQKETIKEVEQEQDNYDSIKLSQSLKHITYKEQSKVMTNSASCKVQISSQNEYGVEEDNKSFTKGQFSLKDTSVSHLESNNKNKIKISIIESQILKNEDTQKITDRIQLQKEIQKERVLRRNLEQSYNMLLSSIKQSKFLPEENQSIMKDQAHHHTENGVCLKRQNSKRKNFSSKSKTEKSIELKEEQQLQDLQDIYGQHLQRQKCFQSTLLQQIDILHDKIEKLQNTILRTENTLKEKKLTIHLNRMNASNTINIDKQTKPTIKKLHNMFLMFIVFLIIAMALKNKRK